MNNLFKFVYTDGTVYEGRETYQDTGWCQAPNKEVKELHYRLPTGDCLLLSGYTSFFHMVEVCMDVMGGDQGVPKIESVYIMGRRGDKINSYRITILTRHGEKYKSGDITKREFDSNSPFIKGTNPDNWIGI